MHLDLTFKPIPRSCPIPSTLVACVGGIIQNGGTAMLWNDRRTITIQFPASQDLEELNPDHPVPAWDLEIRTRRAYGHYLEIIQNLVSSIEFGATNWGYLLPDQRGSFRILQRQKIFKKISCPLWAPLILETDIEYTVWGIGAERRGIWKGKEVDIFYAWNGVQFWRLNRGMYGYRAVQDLDVTFEVLGHLISKDGTVIGLVSEAAWGRMVKPSDATLIYKTVAKIQNRGIIYKGCLTNRFMIADGKVRLVELNCITPYEDKEKVLEDADKWHWDELGQLFYELRTVGAYGSLRWPHRSFFSTYKDLDFLAPTPRLGGQPFAPFFRNKIYQHRVVCVNFDTYMRREEDALKSQCQCAHANVGIYHWHTLVRGESQPSDPIPIYFLWVRWYGLDLDRINRFELENSALAPTESGMSSPSPTRPPGTGCWITSVWACRFCTAWHSGFVPHSQLLGRSHRLPC